MARADKAALRLTVGLGVAVLVAYGFALPMPFVVCVMAVILLSKPGPPMPLARGAATALVLAVMLTAGVLMVPVLENYALTGVLLTAAVLYAVFYKGLRAANPVTMVLVMAFALIPVAGVADQALVGMLSLTVATGVVVGGAVKSLSYALFPDEPAAGAKSPAARSLSHETAAWIALRATVIVMPVFVLALTNPSLYLAAIMKTVTLGQQAGETNARSAGKELVGSTLMGALVGACVWLGLSRAGQPVDADALADGRGPVVRNRDVRRAAQRLPAVLLEQRADHGPDPARPGHRGQRQRQERRAGVRRADQPVRRRGAVRVGHRLGAGTLA